ncbi:hypothetical protein [Streptomyces roseolilacinus]|uniref:Secreted protein n=1 Tax=Streptomyces roseolilacinus TaxID=66904 RepID=A0A918EN21_9ACTN|nr:hypothetical protein [Streptomyces roseolilacinus]GGQ21188.1 hypothetical protein GCM10010249_44810 [Streptomyces roseolilacinus]
MRLKQAMVAVTASAGLVFCTGGMAAAEKSVSTKLSNGVLTVIAEDGCVLGGNCKLFFPATQYKKTSGSKVSIQLALDTGNSLHKTEAMTISSGQTKSKSWGGMPKSKAKDCSVAGYMVATTGKYWTPNLKVC